MPKITRFLPLGRGLWPRPRGAHIWCRCAASVALAAELRGLRLVVHDQALQGAAVSLGLSLMESRPRLAVLLLAACVIPANARLPQLFPLRLDHLPVRYVHHAPSFAFLCILIAPSAGT